MRFALLALFLARCAFSADYSSLYDSVTLVREKPRLHTVLDDVVTRDIRPYLTDAQARVLADLQFDLPLVSASRNPADFYSTPPSRVTMPVLSLLFVEDLAKAYAWLWANSYTTGTVDDYFGMLRCRQPADFPGAKYPAPLTALHIPANALDNPNVKKMFLRVRSTAYSFMVLNEFAHLKYGAATEEDADTFTLEILKRNSETPAGLMMLLHALLHLPVETHPVTAPRLLAMAKYLDLRVLEFAEGRPDGKLAIVAIHLLAERLRESASFLSDAEGQRMFAEQGAQTTVASLLPRQQH